MFQASSKIILLFLIPLILLVVSCEAPRENPLDPDNPLNKLYLITGKLLTAEKTARPIETATIEWRNENLLSYTDVNGTFKIQCKYQINGWLLFSKDGYATDSFYVDWSNGKTVTLSQTLNAFPVLDSLRIYSVVRNKYSNTELLLYFEASVSDVDDDVDTLKVICPELSIDIDLKKISSTYFEAKFSDYELNLTNFNDIIGKPFYVNAVTSGNKKFEIGNTTVKRIIRDEIVILSPINSDTLDTRLPVLNWTRFTPGFSFTYTIEIYTDEPEPDLQWQKENISSDEILTQVETELSVTLSNDKFFWVIWCVDEFNNRSRSKPAGFTLK